MYKNHSHLSHHNPNHNLKSMYKLSYLLKEINNNNYHHYIVLIHHNYLLLGLYTLVVHHLMCSMQYTNLHHLLLYKARYHRLLRWLKPKQDYIDTNQNNYYQKTPNHTIRSLLDLLVSSNCNKYYHSMSHQHYILHLLQLLLYYLVIPNRNYKIRHTDSLYKSED